MAAVLVCDEQLLFGEALAAVLRRRGMTAVAVPDLWTLTRLEDLGSATHVVLALEPARPLSAKDVGCVREACPEAVLVCLTAELRTEQTSVLATTACVVVSKQQPLAEVVQAVLDHDPAEERAGRATPSGRPLGSASGRRRDARPLSAQFLTTREREVLRLLVVGESTQGIAHRLGVTGATARSHVQSVLGRLAVHSRVEAVRYALFHDLVDLEPGAGLGERTSQ
jgi:two-component system nitrate/nitrite response regulator NarL